MFLHFPSVDKQNMFFSAPPYLFTNEEGTAKTIDTLSYLPKRKGKRLHIGVSGFFNYDIVAARKSHGVVLWDILIQAEYANFDGVKALGVKRSEKASYLVIWGLF